MPDEKKDKPFVFTLSGVDELTELDKSELAREMQALVQKKITERRQANFRAKLLGDDK